MNWTVGYSNNPDASPAKRVPAQVPGAVQLDWARAEGWPDYTYADNFKAYAWMEDGYWSYIATVDVPAPSSGDRLFFVCRGIDYRFEVKLNGALLHAQEGMFTPFEIDLTDLAKNGDTLEVLVFPTPKSCAEPVGRLQANQCCKPAVSYGWDWHPRLIPLGIWDETYLETRPATHLHRAELRYELSDDLSHANITVDVELSGAGRIRWTLIDRAGKAVAQAISEVDSKGVILAELPQPELWWPNGQGDPVLYTSVVELLDANGNGVEEFKSSVGFRRVQLVMHPNQWGEAGGFPKGRNSAPITMEINGRSIFCKGTNWVNPEIFPGVINAETYRPLLELARDAHMNMLRVWGGGIVNKESFYEQCDALGLMVWQEFPLACNNYVGTPAYLSILDQESRSIICRLRQHACLVLWCGGNELFNAWSGMTDQSPALRLLNRNCYDLDPKTPFLMTSPLMGMAHGNYLFRYQEGMEVFEVMPLAKNTAYTEFGCPGPSSVEYLKKLIPAQELFPPKPGTAWETHHGFSAWMPDTWLQVGTIEYYFGASPDLETLVARGQWLQCEGYKCIYEESRRQKPSCSMALNWCYNEPWPCAANNSLVNWPAEPKPSYHAVAASCRPSLASARIPKFVWTEGEFITPELWMLHDGPEALPAGRLEAFLTEGDQEVFLLAWDFPKLQPNTNLPGPTIRNLLPRLETDRVTLKLRVVGRPEMDSQYDLVYRSKVKRVQTGAAVLNL